MGRRRGWGGSPPDGDAEAARRIVAAAVALIDQTGAAISIAQVAESLGVIRQTVYRYFPTAADLMRAAAIASVDGFLDGLAEHLTGIDDPAEAMTEGILYTLREVPRRPRLGLLLEGSAAKADEFLSADAMTFGMAMITRYDVDWAAHGYDDAALHELVEHSLRTMQSFVISPGDPPRDDDQLRRYLRRWLGTAISAQTEVAVRA